MTNLNDKPVAWVVYLNDESGTPIFFEDDGILKPWEKLEQCFGKAIPLYMKKENK